MSETTTPIEKLPFRQHLEFQDNIIVESLEDPSIPTSRTTIEEVKKIFTGKITEKNDGFISGKNIHEQLEILKSADNNVCVWKQTMADLFTITLSDFIQLQYDCCLVPSSVSDFPADLREEDNNAYLFTNRNASDGVQILIGAQSGYQYTRRLNNGVLTEWDVVQGSTIYYAVFDIDLSTGELSMHTDPGYSGANFTIEDGNLIVTI